ncbi:hypothetical protein [Parasitella parasitica]|uniref:No apical meristem-associated C-terminal domain-containing protein n=1 Tax=Parasitella parasitica TaxID=35722 RepID=A0A0B7NBD7_9FUNG|nr:hypothetical protein [Parasitella parasitica]
MPRTNEDIVPGTIKQWTPEETLALCHAWKSVSNDAITGRDRKGPTFWDNVAELLNKNESVKEEISTDKVKSHFSRVSKSVSKFCGCVAAMERKYTSGETPEDKLGKCLALYQALNAEGSKKKKGPPFYYYSCYLVLSTVDKWRTTYILEEKKKWKEDQEREKAEAKAKKVLASIPVPLLLDDVDNVEDPDARPIGRKRAKTSSLGSHKASLEEIRKISDENAAMDQEILKEFKRQNDLKERELALQEKRLMFEMRAAGYLNDNLDGDEEIEVNSP